MKCAFDPTYSYLNHQAAIARFVPRWRPPPGFVLTGHPQSYSGPEVRFWDMMRDVGLVAIKDVIANFARDRDLPSFSSYNRFQNTRILGKLCANESRRHGIRSPLRRGLGIVDVNVLYHSLCELPSPQQVWGHLSEMATISSSGLPGEMRPVRSLDPKAFLGTNPTGRLITSGLLSQNQLHKPKRPLAPFRFSFPIQDPTRPDPDPLSSGPVFLGRTAARSWPRHSKSHIRRGRSTTCEERPVR
jgi:hypothetical protein